MVASKELLRWLHLVDDAIIHGRSSIPRQVYAFRSPGLPILVHPVTECALVHPRLELTIPTGRSVDPVAGDNWEGTRVRPDVETPALEAALTRVT